MRALNKNQLETLRVLEFGVWYRIADVAECFKKTFRSLVRRGYLERRGNSWQAEITLTAAGAKAYQEKK